MLAVTGALALLATAIVYGAQVVNLDGPGYCWNSWRGEHVPWSDSADDGDKGFRVKSDERPSADDARGECEIHFALDGGRAAERPPMSRVTLTYGTLPKAADDRRGWLIWYFNGEAAPLPNGLPGLVDTDRGMVVLPRACDVKGEPTVVTLTAEGTWNHSGGTRKGWEPSRAQTARMLLRAAQSGMEGTGCAGEEQLATDGLVLREPMDAPLGADELCALPGMPRTEDVLSSLRTGWGQGLGAPRAAAHVCSYRVASAGDLPATDAEGLILVATSDPRLRAVLLAAAGQDRGERHPGWGDRDTSATVYEGGEMAFAQARCTGRSSGTSEKADTVFAVVRGHKTRTSPTKVPPSDVLPSYVKSMQGPMGCGEVAPRG